jgi:hypothetical protein
MELRGQLDRGEEASVGRKAAARRVAASSLASLPNAFVTKGCSAAVLSIAPPAVRRLARPTRSARSSQASAMTKRRVLSASPAARLPKSRQAAAQRRYSNSELIGARQCERIGTRRLSLANVERHNPVPNRTSGGSFIESENFATAAAFFAIPAASPFGAEKEEAAQ